MKIARDSQKRRVYAAERTLAEYRARDLGSRPSTDDVQRFVDKVLADKYVQRRFGQRVIRVRDARGRRSSCGGYGEIRMLLVHRNRQIVLHEVAHCLAHWGPEHAFHGWRFCEVYLFLVRRVLGVDAERRLKTAFRAHRVRFSKPRKRVLTEEQKQALRERLNRYRDPRLAVAANPASPSLDIARARAEVV